MSAAPPTSAHPRSRHIDMCSPELQAAREAYLDAHRPALEELFSDLLNSTIAVQANDVSQHIVHYLPVIRYTIPDLSSGEACV